MQFRKYSGGGYSLIEMMTVIAVMAILLVVGVPHLTNYGKDRSLEKGAEQMVQAINKVKAQAMAPPTDFNQDTYPDGGSRVELIIGSRVISLQQIPDCGCYELGKDFQNIYLPSGVRVAGVKALPSGTWRDESNCLSCKGGVHFKYGLYNMDDSGDEGREVNFIQRSIADPDDIAYFYRGTFEITLKNSKGDAKIISVNRVTGIISVR